MSDTKATRWKFTENAIKFTLEETDEDGIPTLSVECSFQTQADISHKLRPISRLEVLRALQKLVNAETETLADHLKPMLGEYEHFEQLLIQGVVEP